MRRRAGQRPTAPSPDEAWEAPTRSTRRWLVPAVAVGAAALLALELGGAGTGGRAADSADDAPIEVTGDDRPRTPEDPAVDPEHGGRGGPSIDPVQESVRGDGSVRDPPPIGRWRGIADAPVPDRAGALAVWTGAEVLIWGGWTSRAGDHGGDGRADGAAYAPADDTWRRVADAPRPVSGGEQALWTGDEMVVLGARPMAYDPQADTWRDIALPPAGTWWWPSAGRAGDEIVVVGSTGPGDDPAATAYHPEADTWRALPSPPVQGWDGSASTELGSRLVVTGTLTGEGAPRTALTVFDPGRRAWSEPDAAPLHDRWFPQLLTASQGRVIAAGSGGPRPQAVYAWTPEEGWDRRPDVPATVARQAPTMLWTGDALLAWGGGDLASGGAMLWREDEWAPVARSPLTSRSGEVAVWTGHELVVWGGSRGLRREEHGAALRVDARHGGQARLPASVEALDWRWRRLADAPTAAEQPSIEWTGRDLLVWGGDDHGRLARGGAAYDRAEDAWRPLRDAPVEGRRAHVSVWTGSELLVWGGRGQDGMRHDGFAHDPEARRWRTIPVAPIQTWGGAVGAWTGRELVVLTGGPAWRAAAYEPQGETWRLLPEPPVGGHQLGAVWTGEEVVVVSDAVSGSVARYDPVRDTWSQGADRPSVLPSQGVEVGWTGDEVLAWGGHVARPSRQGWAYDPHDDDWRRLPDAWLGGTHPATGPVWTGQYWVVRGADDHGRPGLAAYHPSTDRWLALPLPPVGPGLTGPMAWTGTEALVWSAGGALWALQPSD